MQHLFRLQTHNFTRMRLSVIFIFFKVQSQTCVSKHDFGLQYFVSRRSMFY